MVGAAALGVTTLISGTVTGLPHLVAGMWNRPAPAFAVPGKVSPGVTPTGPFTYTQGPWGEETLCDLQGEYVVPAAAGRSRPRNDHELEALVENSAIADEASGNYVFQATGSETVVVTGVHAVVLKKVAASRRTVLEVNGDCSGAGITQYVATLDLDAEKPLPTFTESDPDDRMSSIPVKQLTFKVTEGDPVDLIFDASTTKYDVTWRIRVDYTVDGEAGTGWVGSGAPFHVIATRPDDPKMQIP
ncbi:hypothetical protein GA0115240_117921 [Streptomyces sp. DvalAA-14]|nr:hypothetical protein GA0115240_117921 [Streptomyces sp. DvalAA-14]